MDHYKISGVAVCTHGITGKSPITTSFERVCSMLEFVKNLASSISMPIPGRLQNFRDEWVQLLPIDMSKMPAKQQNRRVHSQLIKVPFLILEHAITLYHCYEASN